MKYYALEGETIVPCDDLDTWMRFMCSQDRRVKATTTKNGWISTAFLGLDYNFCSEGEPLLFETMIFYGPLDMTLKRCWTWDQAEIQHEAMCEACAKLKLRRKARKKIKLQIRGTWCSTYHCP